MITMTELSKAAVFRIAKAAGAERIGDDASAALIAAAEKYIKNVTKKVAGIAALSGRMTIKTEDITLAK